MSAPSISQDAPLQKQRTAQQSESIVQKDGRRFSQQTMRFQEPGA
jgi:hypothetical protein